jgi:hypothetical protein
MEGGGGESQIAAAVPVFLPSLCALLTMQLRQPGADRKSLGRR